VKVNDCPQCGAPGGPSERRCTYCKVEFFITSVAYLGNFDAAGVGKYMARYNAMLQEDPASSEALLGLAICYLQTGAYTLANMRLTKLMEIHPECAPAYYYSSLSTIRGRRLKTLTLSEVRVIESYLGLASELDPSRPEFTLLLAMVKRDYYETNGLMVPPPAMAALLSKIGDRQIARREIDQLLSSVKVTNEGVYFSTLQII
jgi:hypothetical protein